VLAHDGIEIEIRTAVRAQSSIKGGVGFAPGLRRLVGCWSALDDVGNRASLTACRPVRESPSAANDQSRLRHVDLP
jgi:hypothetical protein